MSSTAAAPATNPRTTAPPVREGAARPASEPAAASHLEAPLAGLKPVGYGLPCIKCRTYYAANVKVCPVCQTAERVSPVVAPVRTVIAPAASEETPDLATLEAERERFLRDFKAQLLTSQMQVRSAPTTNCTRAENHQANPQTATICQTCFDHLQERVDILEAALHIDLKEASQIVYEAVWADTSDSTKTYDNAAHALLNELRKRAGVTQTFGILQPLSD
ncbi:MAG: hypothetical protein WBQ09_15000 [Terriglobales bacterium]